jgi:hypothetical protein
MRSLMVTAILFWLIFSANQALGQCEPKGLNCIDSLGRRQGYFIEQRVFFLNWEVGVKYYKHSIYLNGIRIGIQDYKTEEGRLLMRTVFFDSTERKLEIAVFYYNGTKAKSGLFTYDPSVYDSAFMELDDKARVVRTGKQGAYTGNWKYFNQDGKEVSKEEFAIVEEEYWHIRWLGVL